MSQDTLPPSDSDDDGVRYDLAGNPLPPRPSQTAAPRVSVSVPVAAPLVESITSAPSPRARPDGGLDVPPRAASRRLALPLGLGAAVFAVVLALIFGLRALRPVAVTAPKSYKTYTALDSSFSCDSPDGWTRSESGSQGGSISQVSFELGPARVKVVSDAAGSLLSESYISANANLPPDQQKPPVQTLHEKDKSQLADTLTDYAEQPAQKIQTPFGDARVSEWTATGKAGSLHGYRATMLGREREITVICLAPAGDWAALQPAFQRIINSVTPGSG